MRIRYKAAVLGLFLASSVPVLSQQTADIDSLLAKIATYEYGQSREPLTRLRALLEEAMSTPSALKKFELRLLTFIQSDASLAGRNFAIRELSIIGSEASVPVLARMLREPPTAEIASYALARIPGKVSTDALRDSLGGASGNIQLEIINALGQRHDGRSVGTLKAFLSSPNQLAREAAITALAEIGNEGALQALAEARKAATGPGAERLSEAFLHCARRLAEQSQKVLAVKAYKQLLAANEPERIRIAALGALTETDTEAALPDLTAALQAKTPAMRAAAIRFASGIAGDSVTAVLVKRFPEFESADQARLLAALTDRGDPAARSLLVSAAQAGAGEVRIAALRGLGELGDGTSVSILAAASGSGQTEERETARASLYRLHGVDVDKAIIAALRSTSGQEKLELITAVGERSLTGAAEALVGLLSEPEPSIHREALRSLRNVAGPEHIPVLLELLQKSSSASDRKEISQTLASVLKRSESTNVQAVLNAYKENQSTPSRVALLEVMGQTSAEKALPDLRAALKDSSPEIARAAILALSGWNTPEPLPDLLSVAQAGGNPTLKVLALRGYIKLLGAASSRTPAESARMLAGAMSLAQQPAEKRSVLSLLAAYPSKEALEVAEAALRDEAISKEAKVAIDRINGLLKFQ